MFDLGLQELIVIFVVALIVFGPKKLPELAKSLGRGLSELKRAMFDVKAEMDKEALGLDKVLDEEAKAEGQSAQKSDEKPSVKSGEQSETKPGDEKGPYA